MVTWLSSSLICAVEDQMSSKSDDFSLKNGNLAIFKMAAIRHLRFVMTSQYCLAGYIFVVQILSCNFMLIGFVVSEIVAIRHTSPFWLYIMDHGNFGVVHTLYHVTLSRGVQNNHCYEIFDPYLPIHYATFVRLRWWLSVLRGVSPLLSELVPSKMVPKMTLIRGNGGL